MSITSGNFFRAATLLSALPFVQKAYGQDSIDPFFTNPPRFIETADVDETVKAIKAEYDIYHVKKDIQEDGCHNVSMIASNVYVNWTYAAKQEDSVICYDISSENSNNTCISTDPNPQTIFDTATWVLDLNDCARYLNLSAAKDTELVFPCEWNITGVRVTNCSDNSGSENPSATPSQKQSDAPTPVVIHTAISSADAPPAGGLALALLGAGALLG